MRLGNKSSNSIRTKSHKSSAAVIIIVVEMSNSFFWGNFVHRINFDMEGGDDNNLSIGHAFSLM